jgi:hypothetical protein
LADFIKLNHNTTTILLNVYCLSALQVGMVSSLCFSLGSGWMTLRALWSSFG